jgi:hypothetical protein
MKFNADRHFIYITMRANEHKKQLQSYYKLTKEDIEEITKDWSADLVILVNPTELSDIDSPETVPDTPVPRKTKKPEKVHEVDSAFVRISSITPDEGGYGEEIEGIEIEQNKGELPLPRDEEDLSKKRKVSPLKSSSRKKPRTPVTNMQTTLTLDDFDFIVAVVNDDSKEIIEKQEVNQEQMYNRIEIELQGVQQELQSSCVVPTAPLTTGTVEPGDDPAQLRRIADMVEARLRQPQEDIVQAT